MLGIRTRGRRTVGADETTELWRPPQRVNFLPDHYHLNWKTTAQLGSLYSKRLYNDRVDVILSVRRLNLPLSLTVSWSSSSCSRNEAAEVDTTPSLSLSLFTFFFVPAKRFTTRLLFSESKPLEADILDLGPIL